MSVCVYTPNVTHTRSAYMQYPIHAHTNPPTRAHNGRARTGHTVPLARLVEVAVVVRRGIIEQPAAVATPPPPRVQPADKGVDVGAAAPAADHTAVAEVDHRHRGKALRRRRVVERLVCVRRARAPPIQHTTHATHTCTTRTHHTDAPHIYTTQTPDAQTRHTRQNHSQNHELKRQMLCAERPDTFMHYSKTRRTFKTHATRDTFNIQHSTFRCKIHTRIPRPETRQTCTQYPETTHTFTTHATHHAQGHEHARTRARHRHRAQTNGTGRR
jgi:hypothetical protein